MCFVCMRGREEGSGEGRETGSAVDRGRASR